MTQCFQTFYTPDGQITLHGSKRAPLGSPAEFEEAVTGGTGEFRHARGYATYTLTNPGETNPLYRVRIHLSKAAH
ncbi:dirigent protein [Streptomyces sp. NPDC055709]